MDENSDIDKSTKYISESDWFQSFNSEHINIQFESQPVWLSVLNDSVAKHIIFPDFKSMYGLKSFIFKNSIQPSLYLEILKRLVQSNSVVFGNSDYSPVIHLLSGSSSFWSQVVPQVKRLNRAVGIFEGFKIERNKSISDPDVKTVRHQWVGGGSTFQTIYVKSNHKISPAFTTIRRTLGAFLNFKHKVTDHVFAQERIYSETDLLSLQVLPATISLPMTYYPSKMGQRHIFDDELSHILGLQSSLQVNSTDGLENFVPIQILDTLIKSVLTYSTKIQKQSQGPNNFIPSIFVENPKGFWISSLKAYLPSTWSTMSSDLSLVAKNDDATIPLFLWDQRIIPLFPKMKSQCHFCNTQCLEHFRILMSRFAKRKFTLEIIKACAPHKNRGVLKSEIDASVLKSEIDVSTSNSNKYATTTSHIKVFKSGIRESTSKSNKYEASHKVLNLKLCSIIKQYTDTSYMSWNSGSSIYFWRWSKPWQIIADEGLPPKIKGVFPSHMRPARRPKAEFFKPTLQKFTSFIRKGYFDFNHMGFTKSLIDYFCVPKGTDDVRVVFNGTSSGINNTVWAQNFWLPMAESLLRVSHFGSKYIDLDLGEMFLNFNLHSSLQPYSGVDLTPFKKEIAAEFPHLNTSQKRLIGTWNRTWMGFSPSPETSIRMYYVAEEFVRGNRRDPKNPLRWDKVVLNSYGNQNYNPSLPTVYKWDNLSKMIAGDIKAFVDDLRVIGHSLENAWSIARQVATRLQYLGIQDAPRKRRIDHGPWVGTIYHTSSEKLQKSVTQKKWDKACKYIEELQTSLSQNVDTMLDYKWLEQIRGFFCHLAMTYEILFPFLKGFHLTLASFLPKRDKEGWKMQDSVWSAYLTQHNISSSIFCPVNPEDKHHLNPPKHIEPVPRFWKDFKVLKQFFSLSIPPLVTIRSTKILLVLHGFVDASKSGFGSTICYGLSTKYRIGTWGRDLENESSNWREFANLVETIEEDARLGLLNECIIYMATDNSTVEHCMYKGNSSSPKLHDLIVRLRQCEFKHGFRILITHVSGERMKAQGTDGISRGSLREGVSIGKFMHTFCPWGENCFQRAPSLKGWVKSWISIPEFLEPEDWFERGHDHFGGYRDSKNFWRINEKPGHFVWSPPPAGADCMLEELRKARIKRHTSTHFILIPTLFTHLWKRQLLKACDITIQIPAIHEFWDPSQYEPLTLGICFPFLIHPPFQFRSTPKMFRMARELHQMFKTPSVDTRDILRKFLLECKRISSMSPSVVWGMLYFKSLSHVSCRSGGFGGKRKRTK